MIGVSVGVVKLQIVGAGGAANRARVISHERKLAGACGPVSSSAYNARRQFHPHEVTIMAPIQAAGNKGKGTTAGNKGGRAKGGKTPRGTKSSGGKGAGGKG